MDIPNLSLCQRELPLLPQLLVWRWQNSAVVLEAGLYWEGNSLAGRKEVCLRTTEIKKETNTNPCSVCNEVSLSDSTGVLLVQRESRATFSVSRMLLALPGSNKVCGFLVDWLLA